MEIGEESNSNRSFRAEAVGADKHFAIKDNITAKIEIPGLLAEQVIQAKYHDEVSEGKVIKRTFYVVVENGVVTSGFPTDFMGKNTIKYLTEAEALDPSRREELEKAGIVFEKVTRALEIYEKLQPPLWKDTGTQKEVRRDDKSYAYMSKPGAVAATPEADERWSIQLKSKGGRFFEILQDSGDVKKARLVVTFAESDGANSTQKVIPIQSNALLGVDYDALNFRVVITLDQAVEAKMRQEFGADFDKVVRGNYPDGMSWEIKFASANEPKLAVWPFADPNAHVEIAGVKIVPSVSGSKTLVLTEIVPAGSTRGGASNLIPNTHIPIGDFVTLGVNPNGVSAMGGRVQTLVIVLKDNLSYFRPSDVEVQIGSEVVLIQYVQESDVIRNYADYAHIFKATGLAARAEFIQEWNPRYPTMQLKSEDIVLDKLSADGKFAIFATIKPVTGLKIGEVTLYLYDVASGEIKFYQRSTPSDTAVITDIAISPDNRILLAKVRSEGEDFVKGWDLRHQGREFDNPTFNHDKTQILYSYFDTIQTGLRSVTADLGGPVILRSEARYTAQRTRNKGQSKGSEQRSEARPTELHPGGVKPNYTPGVSFGLSKAMITVAAVFFGIFSVPVAQAHPAAVETALNAMNPAWFVSEKRVAIDSRALMGDAAQTIAQMPIKIGRIYSALPESGGAEFEFLADLLAVNPMCELIFTAGARSKTSALTPAQFRGALIKRVHEIRGDKSGVRITLKDSSAAVFAVVNQPNVENGLLFSDDLTLGGTVLGGVVAIHNTSSKSSEVVAGLAAGVLEAKKTPEQRKTGWRSLSELLAGYFELAQQVQRIISASA